MRGITINSNQYVLASIAPMLALGTEPSCYMQFDTFNGGNRLSSYGLTLNAADTVNLLQGNVLANAYRHLVAALNPQSSIIVPENVDLDMVSEFCSGRYIITKETVLSRLVKIGKAAAFYQLLKQDMVSELEWGARPYIVSDNPTWLAYKAAFSLALGMTEEEVAYVAKEGTDV